MQFAACPVLARSMADPKSFCFGPRRYQFKVSPGVRLSQGSVEARHPTWNQRQRLTMINSGPTHGLLQVTPCTRSYSHKWTLCPCAHAGKCWNTRQPDHHAPLSA